MARVERALLSVSDKAGLVPFARALAERGVELVSTGGTAKKLREAGLEVRAVSDLTGFAELMDGRVKTLHPAIHGGILARRDRPDDLAAIAEHGIAPIDLVVVNLYPFRETVAAGCTLPEAMEKVDIGGPCMVRAAAKTHAFVGVVTNPADYDRVIEALDAHGGDLPADLRRELAAAAFAHTAAYDAAIAAYMGDRVDADQHEEPPAVPRVLGGPLVRREVLRYGENPHQAAGLYLADEAPRGLALAESLQGKPLSYNNWIDLNAAFNIARDLGPEGVCIIKHTNPCGAARSAESLADAYVLARDCDPLSYFGGIVATRGVVDEALASLLTETFLEVVVAGGVTEGAKRILANKKRLRVLSVPQAGWARPERELLARPLSGVTVVQEADLALDDVRGAKVVTKRAPSDEEWTALEFGWLVVKHVKSNAIVFTASDRTVGVGAGQMSRVDSVNLAVRKAQSSLEGTAVASDAFFPFPDGVEAAAAAGATAVIQPGGSIKDQAVIEAADKLGVAMVFTGHRHFMH